MYTAEISRSNPTALLFIVDQSASMSDSLAGSELSKAARVADVLNRTLATLITRCTKSEGTRNYFEIGLIAYGGSNASNGFSGHLASSVFNPIAEIEKHPLRLDVREKKMDDGAGGVVINKVTFPVWFDPHSEGGTPMCKALTLAAEALVGWCDAHPDCYPPTVLHITDGESTDGDPEVIASQMKQISTGDGEALLFNCHISSSGSAPILFPAAESALPDAYAKLLFRMSSPLPDHLIRFAQQQGNSVGLESRGFFFNADTVGIVDFFDIGTRASQLR